MIKKLLIIPARIGSKRIKNKNDEFNYKDLSLGMSNDYIEALNYKTSFIRIGTKIFGERT